MNMPSSRWWWDLSTLEFSQLDMQNVVAILPIGAVEQHGPHLPVRVDAAINAGIVARAVELLPVDLPVLVLPALPVGKSDEHLEFPGTLSLPYDVLGKVWFEVAKSVWRAGGRKLIFWNSRGGQPQLMEIVCRQLRIELEMFAVGASWLATIDSSDLYSATERAFGIHGGESETSVMLHLHPAGVTGNAAAADAARGAIEVERAAQALVRLAQEVYDYPLASVTQTTRFRQ